MARRRRRDQAKESRREERREGERREGRGRPCNIPGTGGKKNKPITKVLQSSPMICLIKPDPFPLVTPARRGSRTEEGWREEARARPRTTYNR